MVKDKPIVFQNLHFDYDGQGIRESSYGELIELAQMPVDNYNLHIKIDGHTCSMGSEVYNLGLSERRAASIVRYLLTKGVNENQVSYTGFGKSIPVASNVFEPVERRTNGLNSLWKKSTLPIVRPNNKVL